MKSAQAVRLRWLRLADRRVKIKEIADIVDISTERIQNILHEKLGMRKLSARWVRVCSQWRTSEHYLDMFKRNPKEFLRRFVTVDETWIHHYTPAMKEQSKQWTSLDERAPKKAKTVSPDPVKDVPAPVIQSW